jgi:hypothetical protein
MPIENFSILINSILLRVVAVIRGRNRYRVYSQAKSGDRIKLIRAASLVLFSSFPIDETLFGGYHPALLPRKGRRCHDFRSPSVNNTGGGHEVALRDFSFACVCCRIVFGFQRTIGFLHDSPATLSLSTILVYDRDMLHNARPFETTNETTITVHLVSAEGPFSDVHLAQDDLFTSNVQSFYGPPLGTYDGATTLSFTLTEGDGPKTVWAVLESNSDISFPPTSGTLTLDTRRPIFTLLFTHQPSGGVLVDVLFSETVHGFTDEDVVVGGTGGWIDDFVVEGESDHFSFILHSNGSVQRHDYRQCGRCLGHRGKSRRYPDGSGHRCRPLANHRRRSRYY